MPYDHLPTPAAGRWLSAIALAAASLCTRSSLAQGVAYEFDPAFNGNYSIDAFSTGEAAGAERYGGKLVRLPDGDVVTAGTVRLDNDPIAPYWNIGLLRTSPGGSRQVWSGSGAYFHAGRQYVVYPNLANGGSGVSTIRRVVDLAYANGFIYVLANSRFSAAPLDDDVQLFVFREDGSYVNVLNVFGSSAVEEGIALSVLETGSIANPVAIAVLGVVSGLRGSVAKYLVNSSNQIQLDSSFGGGDGRVEFVLPLDECTYPDCDYRSTDIAFPLGGGGGSNKPLYISGWVRRDSPASTDFDMVVIKFTPAGLPDTSFDFNGARQYAFDQQGSAKSDLGAALIATRSPLGNFDTVWMLGTVSRRCSQGLGVVKLDGASGAPVSDFGSAGRAVFGDDATPPGDPCEFEASLEAGDLVRQDDEIGVAATGFYLDQNGATVVQIGVLLRLSASTGQQYSLDGLALTDGAGIGKTRISGIATGEGGGRYYISGRGQSSQYNSLYVTARLKPGDDTLFRDGFD